MYKTPVDKKDVTDYHYCLREFPSDCEVSFEDVEIWWDTEIDSRSYGIAGVTTSLFDIKGKLTITFYDVNDKEVVREIPFNFGTNKNIDHYCQFTFPDSTIVLIVHNNMAFKNNQLSPDTIEFDFTRRKIVIA